MGEGDGAQPRRDDQALDHPLMACAELLRHGAQGAVEIAAARAHRSRHDQYAGDLGVGGHGVGDDVPRQIIR